MKSKNERENALIQHLQLTDKDDMEAVNCQSYNEQEVKFGCSEEYLVVTDDEADDLWEESLDHYIDDCIMPEIPDYLQFYFDEEKWKKNVQFDGRGHSLARYNNEEYEEKINGTIYYIYRIN